MILIISGLVFGLAVLGLILVLLLRRQLREKYATLWLLIGIAFLVLALFPELLLGLSAALGVAVPSNLLFALAIVLLIGVALHLSWELSHAEDEVRRVAEDVAILRAEVEQLRSTPSPGAPGESDPGAQNPAE
ncbi:DUF2304 domain-containing protein [Microbacterium sp. zg.Y909]|uniref:DUF2304 domain-containing protein n=1 Tax=Microbacterium sp. zg.Y909 TaxID=2969413 RepID=UPI00214C655E|nr:DUF2304 domain-containing protein [Microbacterium sp. zg.Y909]MCR2824000.1 DUF2304 domain-containing protein [Microbacterium sp. zg.Y909]